MKRGRSKFWKRYQDGGFFDKKLFDKAPGANVGLKAGIGVGASFLDSLGPGIGKSEFMDDEEYLQDIKRTQNLNKGFATAENAAISSGFAPAMIIGAGVKGVRMGLRALGVGRGREERAAQAAVTRRTNKDIFNNMMAGAQTRSLLPEYSAPAYGKKGMKFKSKFAKR